MALPVARTQEPSVIKPSQKFKGHTGSVYAVIHLPERQRVITCSYDCSLRLWNLKSGLQIGKGWQDGESFVCTIALSPDRKTLASGSQDGTMRLWDVDTGKVITKWVGHSAGVFSICWSRDGRRMLSGSEDGAFRVWDVESGKTNLEIEVTSTEHTANLDHNLCPVVYSSDETMIAGGGSGKDGKLIKIWDAKTFKLVATLEAPERPVWCLAWTNDGKTLISATSDGGGCIRKWNTTTWKQYGVLTEQDSIIRGIAISPNGRILATASYDKTARLWNLDNDQPIGSPLQHTHVVFCVSFSADGKLLASGCADKNAYTWDVSAIVKEAGLNELLLDSDPLQVPTDTSRTDATCHRVKPFDNTRRLPPRFFDDSHDTGDRIHSSSTRRLSPTALHPSLLRPRALLSRISSLFHHSPHTVRDSTSHATPTPFRIFNSTLAHVSRRHRSDDNPSPPVVNVPCTRGDPRNVHAMQKTDLRSSNNVMTLSIAGPSRLPMSDDVQQSSEQVQVQQSSSPPQDLLTLTMSAAGTPLSLGGSTRKTGGWSRFLCCISSKDTSNPE